MLNARPGFQHISSQFAAVVAFGALLFGAAGSLVAADEAKALPASLKAIQGTWVSSADSGFESTWIFEGDTLKSSVNGHNYTCDVTLDADAKPNATADFTITDGDAESRGKVAKAIYKFDGDRLILCISLPGNDRPTDFEPIENDTYLFELKKEKN
jgi:uncharacterized protein (TIGR03067 family)